jgi:hypothetical protein
MARKPQLDTKPQQQTLSIRISDGLREFLERSKQLISNGPGGVVSTSDVAKILLESAKEDRFDHRLEAAELQQKPTDSLWAIRRKWEQKVDLSRPEWIFLAQYIQIACEEVPDNPASTSPKSISAVLEAFLAVRALRTDRGVSLDRYYLSNLGTMGQASGNDRHLDPGVVPEVVGKWLEKLRGAATPERPIFAGRSLCVALRDEELSDVVDLNRALFPFMPTLFRLAARGHWSREHRPLRQRDDRRFLNTVISPVRGDGFSVSFAVGHEGDLSMLFLMDSKDVMYPIAPYPEIREFLAMLEGMHPDLTWNGVHFLAYTSGESPETRTFRFRRRREGIEIGFSEDEWNTVRDLFRKALAAPSLQGLLTELSLVYGDL